MADQLSVHSVFMVVSVHSAFEVAESAGSAKGTGTVGHLPDARRLCPLAWFV